MITRLRWITLTGFALGSMILAGMPAHSEMKAGFAERDITPQKGMEMPVGYIKIYNNGKVHDPLKVRAAVFDDGRSKAALIGVDAGGIRAHLVAAARQQIQRRCGIPPQAVLVGASHTHNGGPSDGVHPGDFDHASELVRKLAYEQSSMENPKYIGMITQAIVEAVMEADRRRVPARACIGSGREDKVAFNRRFRMKNGLTYTHPNDFATFGNPEMLEPAGPIDPEVGVIGAWGQAGQFLGCVVNYANHATNGADGVSADYIYYLEKTIRSVMGKKAIVVFLNGASGDVTQVDNRNPYNIDLGERSARFVGTSIAAEALKVLTRAEPGELTPILAKSEVLEIPRRKPSPAKVKECLEIVKQLPDAVGSTKWMFAKDTLLVDDVVKREPVAKVEVQAIQIGPAIFLANPAEFFSQLGLNIKAGCKFPFTYVVALANDDAGYVPTEEAFGPHGGGYETRLTFWSNLETSAGSQIVKACLRLADSMTPGTIPEPPRKKPFASPWDYGSVAPELD